MPRRLIPIVPQQVYHVFNRSIAKQPIFLNQRDYQRFLETILFYSFDKPGIRFSHFNRLDQNQKSKFLENLKRNVKKNIQILSFCLMPNHFHFLIKELNGSGIVKFMGNLQNSYAKYFNTKNKRTGGLFQSTFKVVRIENDEQFIHVARYIHLNPYTSYILKKLQEIENYNWSSLGHYLNKVNYEFIFSKYLMSFFSSVEKLRKFTLDQADYQRKLGDIKHLFLE